MVQDTLQDIKRQLIRAIKEDANDPHELIEVCQWALMRSHKWALEVQDNSPEPNEPAHTLGELGD